MIRMMDGTEKEFIFPRMRFMSIPTFARRKIQVSKKSALSSNHSAIIISWVIPGNPYPVIEHPQKENNLVGYAVSPSHLLTGERHPIQSGYNSHIVITTKEGIPASDPNPRVPVFDELVIPQEYVVRSLTHLTISGRKSLRS